MKRWFLWLFVWFFIVPLSNAEESAKWMQIKSGQIETSIENVEHNPQVVHLLTQAFVGQSFAWFVRPMDGGPQALTLLYYEYRFLGVSAGSVILKLKTYTASISASNPQQKSLFDKIRALDESRTWGWDYATSVVTAYTTSEEERVTEDALFIPLEQSGASFCIPPLPQTRTGIVFISLAVNTSLFRITFRAFDDVYPPTKGSPMKSQ